MRAAGAFHEEQVVTGRVERSQRRPTSLDRIVDAVGRIPGAGVRFQIVVDVAHGVPRPQQCAGLGVPGGPEVANPFFDSAWPVAS